MRGRSRLPIGVQNTSITLYNHFSDKVTGLQTFKRTVKHGVFWNEDSQSVQLLTGAQTTTDITIYITLDENFVRPELWDSLSNDEMLLKWTVFAGTTATSTFIVRGESDFDFGWFSRGQEQSEILDRFYVENPSYQRANSVNVHDYGNRKMQHVMVGA